MITKTSQAIAAFQAHDFKAALAIAKTFRAGLTREERGILTRGYECLVRPDFYRSIGKNVDVCISEAQVVFFQRILTPATKGKEDGQS